MPVGMGESMEWMGVGEGMEPLLSGVSVILPYPGDG